MKVTLTELCDELNNWFDTKEDGKKDRYYGKFTVSNGTVDFTDIDIKPGQYYRIIGSVYNDGVWQVPNPQTEESVQEETANTPITDTDENNTDTENSEPIEPEPADEENESTEDESEDEEPTLIDEVFDGAIWLMRVPRRVMLLLDKINEWNEKYEPITESPFNAESFGGYSYQKSVSRNNVEQMSAGAINWKSQFSWQLKQYRKLRNI